MRIRYYAVAITLFFIIFAGTSCRKPDKMEPVQSEGANSPEITRAKYLEGLVGIAQLEDQLQRQLETHSDKFEVTWPFTEAAKAARLRTAKIQSVLRDNKLGDAFPRITEVEEASSIEDALKKDAAFHVRIAEKYMEIMKERYMRIDSQLVAMLISDVRKYQILLEKHDGIPPDQLKEYGLKKYRTP